ncbi:MAG: hypothetical protein JSS49_05275 [Planctomycetes bacterium]|nr:hypothetical protein [Planctomycetota bacterium]
MPSNFNELCTNQSTCQDGFLERFSDQAMIEPYSFTRDTEDDLSEQIPLAKCEPVDARGNLLHTVIRSFRTRGEGNSVEHIQQPEWLTVDNLDRQSFDRLADDRMDYIPSTRRNDRMSTEAVEVARPITGNDTKF